MSSHEELMNDVFGEDVMKYFDGDINKISLSVLSEEGYVIKSMTAADLFSKIMKAVKE